VIMNINRRADYWLTRVALDPSGSLKTLALLLFCAGQHGSRANRFCPIYPWAA
jgi:hypothetical protein